MSAVRNFLQSIDRDNFSISTEAAAAIRGGDVLFIDIREESELEGGIIAGALVIARGRLELDFEALNRRVGQKAVIYCASGVRSALAVNSLRAIGFEQVYSLRGGFSAWREGHQPTQIHRSLTARERQRYARQMRLPELGENGQSRLRDAKVVIVGAGGLGSPAALYLAAAGVGTIAIVDNDVVDLSNLHRQILHRTEDVNRPKVLSASDMLRALNPDIQVIPHQMMLDADNVDELLSTADVVVDGSDNLRTRALLNDASLRLQKPIVYGAVDQFVGQVTVFGLPTGPCYRCVYPEDPPRNLTPNCAEAGVLGVAPGVIGVLQANEAIKILLGLGDPLNGRMLNIDLAEGSIRSMQIKRRSNCSCCGGTAPPRTSTAQDPGSWAVACQTLGSPQAQSV